MIYTLYVYYMNFKLYLDKKNYNEHYVKFYKELNCYHVILKCNNLFSYLT